MSSRSAAARVPALYVVVDTEVLGCDRVLPAIGDAVSSGVRWIQLRAKGEDDRTLLELTEGAAELVADSESELWLNDRADIATLVPGVSGLHLGQEDLPPKLARRLLALGEHESRPWIGRSTHNLAQVDEAAVDPDIDLVAVGPIFATVSKVDAEPTIGLEGLRRARTRTDKPLVAIGGIDTTNIGEVLAAGADCAAVLGAACRGSVEVNCRALLDSAGRAAQGV